MTSHSDKKCRESMLAKYSALIEEARLSGNAHLMLAAQLAWEGWYMQ